MSENDRNYSTVLYKKYGVGLRVAAYSASRDLFAIGGDRAGDVFNAKQTSMDFGSSYAVTQNWAVYFNAKNLLNTPHAFYQGTPDRPIQREFYGQTYQLGLRFDHLNSSPLRGRRAPHWRIHQNMVLVPRLRLDQSG